MISCIRGEIAEHAAGKNDGGDNWDISNHPYQAAHESGDPHKGAVTGTIEYDGSEFHVRLEVGGRAWCFRALSIQALRDQVYRFFPGDRGRIKLTLSKTANLARYGEDAAIGLL
jgi:hypothetical protein